MSDVEPTLAESGIGRVVDASEPVIDHDGALSPRAAGGEGPVEELRRRRLFDLDFVDAPSLEPVLSSLLERRRPADDSRMETVLTPNVDIMVHLTQPGAEGSLEWRMFQHSQYCLPDGQPIVLRSVPVSLRQTIDPANRAHGLEEPFAFTSPAATPAVRHRLRRTPTRSSAASAPFARH